MDIINMESKVLDFVALYFAKRMHLFDALYQLILITSH